MNSLTSEPITVLPVTIFEAKKQLQVTHSEDDVEILDLIRAATEVVESRSKRIISLRDFTWTFPGFPSYVVGPWAPSQTIEGVKGALDPGTAIQLPVTPVNSITSITYQDEADAAIVLDAAEYRTILNPDDGWIHAVDSWPGTYSRPDAVSIVMSAGYSNPPSAAKHAIKLLVSHWYENRDDTGQIGNSVKSLIETFKVSYTLGSQL